MSERAPYSRIYWSVMDDERFRIVYRNDGAFALWMRLLMTADALWPAAAPLPRSARPKALSLLVEAGIVELVDEDRYRIHGLDAERNRRKALATTRGPDGDRTVPGRGPDGNLAKPRLAKPSLAEPSTSRAEAPREETVDPADIYWNLTGKYPVDGALTWVDDLTAQFGADPTARALAKAHSQDRSTKSLLTRTKNILAAHDRRLDLRERQVEQARLAEKRSVPQTREPWREEYAAAIAQQYAALEEAS